MVIFFVGLILGLITATITESVGHKFTGHPSRFQRQLYLKYPRLFAAFLKPYYQHFVIHHHRTFKGDFFDQFKDQLEKHELDKWISKKFSPKFSDLVWRERYNLTLKGVAGTLPFAIPFMAGPAVVAYFFGPIAFAGSLLTAFIPVWLSKYVHPLVHLPHETAQAHPFIQWLMRTEYMRRVFKNHYLHHQEMETNFNLLLGGDYLVGLHRAPTADEAKDLETLLPEFDRRVREGLPAQLPAQAEIAAKENAYLALGNPTFEQRFQHLKWKAQIFNHDVEAGRDFGMSLYDKNIEFSNWSKRSEFAIDAYEQDGEFVVYRGQRFQVGDILLTNQSSDSDGLFSTLLTGEISFAHAAMFCILEKDGRRYPSAIEINEAGIRAVPLKALLSRRFNTYVEVFRLRTPMPESAKVSFAPAALQMMSEVHAFDIYQDHEQAKYLNCSRTIAELYRAAGLRSIVGSSFYSLKTLENLKTLGIEKSAGQPLLMPDDYARSPWFKIVGTIDNGCFDDVLARMLMRTRIQEIWRTMRLERSRFPIGFYVNKFFVDAIQQNLWYAPYLVRLARINVDRFPSGPVTFLSLAAETNARMEKGSRILKASIVKNRSLILKFNSWQELWSDSEVRELIAHASESFAGLYSEREAVVTSGLNEFDGATLEQQEDAIRSDIIDKWRASRDGRRSKIAR